MINDNKYVGFEKAGTPVIKSVGANNVDVYIDENGEYEAKAPFTGFGKVVVNVPNRPDEAPSGWIPRKVVNGKVEIGTELPNFTGITDVGDYVYYYAFYTADGNSDIKGNLDLSGLTEISGKYAFYQAFTRCFGLKSVNIENITEIKTGITFCFSNTFLSCTGLESANLKSLKNVYGSNACAYMFKNCSSLKTVNLDSLEYLQGLACLSYMFENCSGLESINLGNLSVIDGNSCCSNMFAGCQSLKDVNLDKLRWLSYSSFYNTFKNCISLQELKFPSLELITDNSLNSMLSGCDGVTVHFKAERQSGWENLPSFLNGFSGTNTTILWDL